MLKAHEEANPFDAIVRIDSIILQPDFFIPWQHKIQDRCSGTGLVISGDRILTNAHNIADATYISVTKTNADESHQAKILAVDHDCDLALLTTDDKTFCKNVHHFELGTTPPPQSPVFVA